MTQIVLPNRVIVVRESYDEINNMITAGWEFLKLTQIRYGLAGKERENKRITINRTYVIEMTEVE